MCTCCTTDLILSRCFTVSLHGSYTFSVIACSLVVSSLSHSHIDLLTLGEEPGAHVSDYLSCPQCLPEADGDSLWCSTIKQKDRRACLNALCFCHNGQAFGGFAHLLQRINLSILHNTTLLHNPNINISPPCSGPTYRLRSWLHFTPLCRAVFSVHRRPYCFFLICSSVLFEYVILLLILSLLCSVCLIWSYSLLTSLPIYSDSLSKAFCILLTLLQKEKKHTHTMTFLLCIFCATVCRCQME